MTELLIELLETFGYPVRLQGSLRIDERYPDSFFTFWNTESYDNNHYDNDAASYTWDFEVNFYSTDPDLVDQKVKAARSLLKANGFVISGKGHDVGSDETTHTGRGFRALIMEREVNNNV